MQAEGANSPADIFLTVDAGRIWLADKDGLLQPVHSDVLDERIPEHLRHPGRPLVRPVAARAGDLLRQGPGAEPAADLRGAGRSGLQGPDLHPHLVEHLQPVADVLDHRQRRRGGGEGLGRGAARQPRPRARGRRQRPDQGGGLRRVRHRGGEHLLLLPRHRERGGRHRRGRRQHRRRLPEPGRTAAPTSTSPLPASPRTRRTRTPRSASSSISRRPRRRPTSPTRTTSIRPPPTPRSPRSRPPTAPSGATR